MNETPVQARAILEVADLSVDFWVDGAWVGAVKELSYRLIPGEVLAIVGESGSGKTAGALAVLGLLPGNGRARGSAKLLGGELIGAPQRTLRAVRGKEAAVIFQEPTTALNPVYTVGFQLCEALAVHGTPTPAAARKRALELLAMVEMADPQRAFDSFPHQLSGGQRQRAVIAQAIACDPVLLIADEPTTALDVTVQAEILDLLRRLHRRLDSAILLITHDLAVVADLADRVLVMADGTAVEAGSVRQIFHEPRHPYTRRLLAAVPHLGARPAVPPAASSAENSAAALPPAANSAAAVPAPVLEARGLSIEYPRRGRVPAFRAVEDASFEIHAGEVVGLVGESGSGKTTLARALVGLLPVHAGRISVMGRDLVGVSRRELMAARRRMGIVFQDPGSALNPRWPVGASIAEPLELAGINRHRINRRVGELLAQVQLPLTVATRYPHELSGGQRQRVGIARALALDPTLLIADEPTSALDVSVQAHVLELLRRLQAELRFACLFISHDLAVVDMLADRIVVMNRGRIVEQGSREQILRAPQHAYTRRLLDAVPVPDPDEQARRRARREGS